MVMLTITPALTVHITMVPALVSSTIATVGTVAALAAVATTTIVAIIKSVPSPMPLTISIPPTTRQTAMVTTAAVAVAAATEVGAEVTAIAYMPTENKSII